MYYNIIIHIGTLYVFNLPIDGGAREVPTSTVPDTVKNNGSINGSNSNTQHATDSEHMYISVCHE